ncbi:MAG: AI-2E family transporter, partial [Mycoplasmatales bacterium]
MKGLNFKVLNKLIYITTIIILILFLKHIGIIDLLWKLLASLTPFYMALIISWLMRPFGKKISKTFKLSERLGNFIAILVNIFVLVGTVLIFLPFVFFQFSSFFDKLPQFVEGLSESLKELSIIFKIDYASINSFVSQYTQDLTFTKYLGYIFDSLGVVISFFGSVFGVISQIVFAYIIAFYFINDIKGFFTKTLKLISEEESFEKNMEIAEEVSVTLYGYTKGLFLVCSAIFVMVTIGSSILGLPYPMLLGLIAAFFNVIPYLGPIIGGIPIFLIALSISLETAAWSLLVIFGSQFVEANFLQPKIMAQQTNLRPTTIIIGLFLFSSLFGFVGILISTPCLAALGVILKHS